MTASHLLLVSLGPVQDFIAQARRMRDLWFGSHLLSELSRAVAKALALQGAELIFPALGKADAELEECDQPIRPGGDIPPLSSQQNIRRGACGCRTIRLYSRSAMRRPRAVAPHRRGRAEQT